MSKCQSVFSKLLAHDFLRKCSLKRAGVMISVHAPHQIDLNVLFVCYDQLHCPYSISYHTYIILLFTAQCRIIFVFFAKCLFTPSRSCASSYTNRLALHKCTKSWLSVAVYFVLYIRCAKFCVHKTCMYSRFINAESFNTLISLNKTININNLCLLYRII